MDENQTKLLRENRVKIVSDLEPRGKVLDTLYEDGILTENDLELVSSAKTRKDRCQLLLSILPTRGPVAYGSFQKALEVGHYEFLADKLKKESHVTHGKADVTIDYEFSNQTQRETKVCQKCKLFLEELTTEGKNINTQLLCIISEHCCLLLHNIEARDVIDQLFQDHVIKADDFDAILAGVTRRIRCELLLKILLREQNTKVVESFKLALMKKYSYIVENIKNDFDGTRLKGQIASTTVEARSTEKQTPNVLTSGIAADDTEVFVHGNHSAEKLENDSIDKVGESSVSPEIQHCRKKRSARSTLDDESSYDAKTELKTITTEITDKDNGVQEKLNTLSEDIDNGKAADGQEDTVDGAFIDTSARHRLLEKVHARKDKDNFRRKTNESNCSCEIASFPDTSRKQKFAVYKKSKSTNVRGERENRSKTSDVTITSDTVPKERLDNTVECRELVPKQMTSIHSQTPSRRLTVAFNYLSTLINQGDFVKFEETSAKLQTRFSTNYDLMCIIGYLQTSRDLFQTNFDSAKSCIDSTMALVPKTSNPRYFMLELFTAKARMYITRKKLEKLQTTLDEAMMILETDPVGCTGRAAGWLYINDARNKTAQLTCLNLRSPNACHVYERLFESAKSSFQRSMTNFKRDGGKDGPFGFGYALCRLVILLLRCGDNGLTMTSLTPSADDIHSAGQYLQHLEDSDIVISKILDMHFRLAKCDYQFRRGNFVRALEHAHIAHDLATELRLFEFTEHAYNRVSFLKSKTSTHSAADELSEEETNRILFEETSGSEYDT